MTLYRFTTLKDAEQYQVIWDGTFLGDRKEPGYNVLLYSVGDFYVEVYYSVADQAINRNRPFRTTRLLESYLDQIGNEQLSDLL